MPAAEFYDVAELERIATVRWTSGLRSFIQGGAGNGDGVRANRLAHARWALRARVLVDVSSIDTSTTVLGIPVDLPIMIAPSGLHTLVLPEGEVATARGARDANTVMVLSSGTGRSIEDVTAVGGNVWFQLYWGSDRTQARRLIDLAGEHGCRALCLTADMPVPPLVGREMRAGVASIAHARSQYLPPRGEYVLTGVWDHDQRLSWRDLAWLRDATDLPIVVKGIMTVEDALIAADSGIDGIVVSNHGGRQIDGARPALDCLPEVVEVCAAAGDKPVLFDSGIRTGSDIIKAVALGARAVLVGRPYVYGLAVGGADGVRHALRCLLADLDLTLALAGHASLKTLSPEILVRAAASA